MDPPRVWKQGERVVITYGGRTVSGRVERASESGTAVMLAFQALLGGFAGHMPALWNPRLGEYQDIIVGGLVELADANTITEGRV